MSERGEMVFSRATQSYECSAHSSYESECGACAGARAMDKELARVREQNERAMIVDLSQRVLVSLTHRAYSADTMSAPQCAVEHAIGLVKQLKKAGAL